MFYPYPCSWQLSTEVLLAGILCTLLYDAGKEAWQKTSDFAYQKGYAKGQGKD